MNRRKLKCQKCGKPIKEDTEGNEKFVRGTAFLKKPTPSRRSPESKAETPQISTKGGEV